MNNLKCYLVMYVGPDWDTLRAHLDKNEAMFPNWKACFNKAVVFVVSGFTPDQIVDSLRNVPNMRHTFIIDVKGDRQGWLPPDIWKFMNEPKPAFIRDPEQDSKDPWISS